ncbi:hypothetical protein ACFL6G_01385 [candidate division KSB1 bacterium]
MNESTDIKKIEQKVNRASQQDGFLEIFLGIFLLYYMVILDNVLQGVKSESPLMIFFFIFALYPVFYTKIIRNKFTYPRIGYVNIKEKITRVYTFTVILPLIILPIFTYLTVRFFGENLDIDILSKWLSIVYGLVFGALYYDFAKKYGQALYYVLGVFAVAAGIALSLIPLDAPGVSVLLFFNTVIIFFHGLFMLVRFIIKNPRPVEKDMNHA